MIRPYKHKEDMREFSQLDHSENPSQMNHDRYVVVFLFLINERIFVVLFKYNKKVNINKYKELCKFFANIIKDCHFKNQPQVLMF